MIKFTAKDLKIGDIIQRKFHGYPTVRDWEVITSHGRHKGKRGCGVRSPFDRKRGTFFPYEILDEVLKEPNTIVRRYVKNELIQVYPEVKE